MGQTPSLLYGYGGFNISITPSFLGSASGLAGNGRGWYAVANLRGGGEIREDWHQGGMKLRSKIVFDDFIGAAEWLHREQVPHLPANWPSKAAAMGDLLVGACLTLQRPPDLFGAALPGVGVNGHAALSPLYDWLGLDCRLRLG